MMRWQRVATVAVVVIGFAYSLAAVAYGPFSITNQGKARYIQDFDGSTSNSTYTLKYYPEPYGNCGNRSNSTMDSLIDTVFSKIEGASLDSISVTDIVMTPIYNAMTDENGALVMADITGTTYDSVYVNGDSATNLKVTNDQTIILYDNDSSITAALNGDCNRCKIVGFGGPVVVESDNPIFEKGQLVVNCGRDLTDVQQYCSSQCGITVSSVSENDFDTVILHEFLHAVGVEHTQVGLEAEETATTSDDAAIATMYPRLENGAQQSSLNKDDIVAIANLYPSSEFKTSFGSISGEVTDKNGEDLPCVEVTASNVNDTTDLITTVTGYEAVMASGGVFPDDCTSNCGKFTIKGLKDGNVYQLTVRNIDSKFSGGSLVGRCDPVEQYDLSGDGTIDADDVLIYSTTLTASAGSVVTGVSFETQALVSDSGSSGGTGSGSSQQVSVCSLYPEAKVPMRQIASSLFFVFTALVLLATGRACVTLKP